MFLILHLAQFRLDVVLTHSCKHSDGASHTPLRGENVKRATNASATFTTLEDYEYVVVGSGAGGALNRLRSAINSLNTCVVDIYSAGTWQSRTNCSIGTIIRANSCRGRSRRRNLTGHSCTGPTSMIGDTQSGRYAVTLMDFPQRHGMIVKTQLCAEIEFEYV